eukprot:1811667-Karenia_brevis.AAC.1
MVSWLCGYSGVRVGEASNPGPQCWQLVSANVTSLITQGDAIAEMSADIIALQETRLSEFGQCEASRHFGQRDWQCFWGKPQPPQQRANISHDLSPWNATHGGVGVLVKKGIPARLAPLDNHERQSLHDTGRWVHVSVAANKGQEVLHVFSIYGFPRSATNTEAMRKNEEFLMKVFDVAAELGNVPILIL